MNVKKLGRKNLLYFEVGFDHWIQNIQSISGESETNLEKIQWFSALATILKDSS